MTKWRYAYVEFKLPTNEREIVQPCLEWEVQVWEGVWFYTNISNMFIKYIVHIKSRLLYKQSHYNCFIDMNCFRFCPSWFETCNVCSLKVLLIFKCTKKVYFYFVKKLRYNCWYQVNLCQIIFLFPSLLTFISGSGWLLTIIMFIHNEFFQQFCILVTFLPLTCKDVSCTWQWLWQLWHTFHVWMIRDLSLWPCLAALIWQNVAKLAVFILTDCILDWAWSLADVLFDQG